MFIGLVGEVGQIYDFYVRWGWCFVFFRNKEVWQQICVWFDGILVEIGYVFGIEESVVDQEIVGEFFGWFVQYGIGGVGEDFWFVIGFYCFVIGQYVGDCCGGNSCVWLDGIGCDVFFEFFILVQYIQVYLVFGVGIGYVWVELEWMYVQWW